MTSNNCTFCKIVERQLPSKIEYEDDDIIIFHNHLGWLPVMLLLVPKAHISQAEMWLDGELIARLGKLAMEFGEKFCPEGFRLVTNLGRDAEQSQPHSHVHLIGGRHLGMYLDGPMRGKGRPPTGFGVQPPPVDSGGSSSNPTVPSDSSASHSSSE